MRRIFGILLMLFILSVPIFSSASETHISDFCGMISSDEKAELEAELALAFSALELLDEGEDTTRSEIIKNILCLGMPQSVERICKKTDKNKKEEKKNSDRGER